jgi:hypothetical protein
VKARREGTGAVTVNARKGASEFLSADLTAGSGAWAESTADQNQSVGAGDDFQMRIKSVTPTPTQLSIQVEGTRP